MKEGELPSQFQDKKDLQGGTIFDKSVPGRIGCEIPDPSVPEYPLPADMYLRSKPPLLPSVSQPDVVRHFTTLSTKNFSIGKGAYPLGSCTMKYNPSVHELIVAMDGFSEVHPAQPSETMQGTLAVIHALQVDLMHITGFAAAALSPMGGAQGELSGVLMIKAYHESHGEGRQRKKMLIPEAAHGTNPASARMAGFDVVNIKTDPDGNMDYEDVMQKMGDGKDIAGVMATQPNTLGLFDRNLVRVAQNIHEVGALVYGDGANMNAIAGKVLPAELGIDLMHVNTHKPFSTPHGGGGPGAGPVMATEELAPFLPGPIVVHDEQKRRYLLAMPEQSIGKISGWAGNVAVLLRAYAYIRTMGEEGLRNATENAVLNANYLKALIEKVYPIKYGANRRVMHEVVVQGIIEGSKLENKPTLQIAKRLIDYGFHPPTIYFPHAVDEALMIEPTETEGGFDGVENLAEALLSIANEAKENPELLTGAPHFTPVGRLDEEQAVRNLVLKWTPQE